MYPAHGMGGGADLPIPAAFAVAAGTAALAVSFIVLLWAWRSPRFVDPGGRPAPALLRQAVDSTAFMMTLRGLGLLLFGFGAVAATAGKDLLINPVFGMFYVWLWVGMVPASLLFGPVVKVLSPARALHAALMRLTGADPHVGLAPYPARLGYWPAALGLFAFVWFELVYPDATYLGPLRLWIAVYLAVMVVGAAVFGSTWFARADPFEVYSTLLARLSVWGRREPDHVLVIRSPLRNLAQTPGRPGLVAVVAVLLGSTGFDSFRSSNSWVQFSQSTTLNITLINTGLLVLACLMVGGTFTLATLAPPVRGDVRRSEVPRRLAHSVVPIIVGYMIAHYLSFLVEVGQQTLIQASDPLTTGGNLFGTSDSRVNYWLSENPTLLATIKVLAIVVGHVLGVIAAHDKAIQLLPRRAHITGQLPLLAAMVAYTFTGLYLLFGV